FNCLSSSEKPSGRTRCRPAPVLAARRITLPVFGGISGWTRTISSMRHGSRDDPVHYPLGAGALERTRDLVERGTRSHDVVKHRHGGAAERARAAKGAAHVALARLVRQLHLRRSIARALAERELVRSDGHMHGDLHRLDIAEATRPIV